MLKEIVEGMNEGRNSDMSPYEKVTNMGGDGELLAIGETPSGDGIILGFSDENTQSAEIEIAWGEGQYELVQIDDVFAEVKRLTGLKLDAKDKLFKAMSKGYYGFIPKG